MSYASWNNFTTYVVSDTVEYAGLAYSAIISNTNVVPPNASAVWSLIASGSGATGPAGPAGATGSNGQSANGSFTYSASAPHGVDSWYYNTPTNIAFSNNGIVGNQNWLLALENSLTGTNDVLLQIIQNGLNQLVKVVSIVVDGVFTYVEFQTLTILPPPSWAETETAFYYVLAGANGASGPTGEAGPVGATGPIGASFNYLTTSSGTTIVQPTQFTFVSTNQECNFAVPVSLGNGAAVSFVPPVVSGSDLLNYSTFIPTQYGFLLVAGSGPTTGTAAPVYNGAPAFYDAFSYNEGDTLSLQVLPTIINYLLNGVVVRTSLIAVPLPDSMNFTFYASSISAGPYTTRNAIINSYGSGPTGPVGPIGPTGAGGTVAYFGNFYSVSDQLLSTTGTPCTYTNTADNFGITFSGSQISIPVAGTYSYTFSAQIVGGANETATLYIVKNGSVVGDSASIVEVKNNEAQLMTVNFINNFNAGDIIEVYGSSPSGLTKIDYIVASGSNPASPSIIFTINQITYAGETGATGPAGGLVIDAGLQNKLGIVPTSSALVSSTVNYTGSGGVGTPSSWVPDQSPPIAGGVNNGWRFVKAAGAGGGTAKINWNPYNPYYGQALPLSPASPAFTKKQLNCVWAVITPTVSINVQGVVFFNLYTYDTTNPPSGAFTSRWDYSANNLALPLTTGGLTLQANFRYLIYCYDAPKIVATPATLTTITNCNGQYPSQSSSELMKDPYDIHTDIPHIGFSAVALTNSSSAPSDPTTVQISQIAFSSTSSAVAAGLDFTVHSIGYRANNGAQTFEYDLVY